MSQTIIPNSPIQFRFRCSAFGFHYYDCTGRTFETFEVCHQNHDIEPTPLGPRWGWNESMVKPDGFDEAWGKYVALRRQEYADWRKRNAHIFETTTTPQ